MTPDQRLLCWAILISGSLYLAGVFAGSLYLHSLLPAMFSLAAVGLNYICYACQLAGWPEAARGVNAAVVGLATVAGIFLLFAAMIGAH